ncbi:protein kinase domain-containing protein [Haliangium sp.]|uniref:serine/threonine-protein kinase n=1 Tax=Haliangium sp. TaxID=2663208 RepID=UPI003D10719A
MSQGTPPTSPRVRSHARETIAPSDARPTSAGTPAPASARSSSRAAETQVGPPRPAPIDPAAPPSEHATQPGLGTDPRTDPRTKPTDRATQPGVPANPRNQDTQPGVQTNRRALDTQPGVQTNRRALDPALPSTTPGPRRAHAAISSSPSADLSAPPASAPDLPPGTVIRQYELIRALGRGGMGNVHLARDLRLGRLVAIKFLAASTAEMNQRFLIEARTTAQCNHENIVVIYEVGEHDGRPYLVLEYLEGQTLRQWWHAHTSASLADGGYEVRTPLPPRRVVELMLPVARALARAHELGIVHRDLKPENIMLTAGGTTKVLDFGIAKQVAGAAPQADPDPEPPLPLPIARGVTTSGGLIGTLPYMSPEQLNEGEIDHRSDLWAVGIMLFELAIGHHPVPQESLSYLYEIADLDEPMPSARERAPELGPLAAIIDRCLIKDRHDRVDSAGALADELAALLPARPTLADDHSPFAGLAPFQEGDADRFFGRDRDIAALVERVQSHPLVTTVGPSGAGKSSLVRAGLVPALERSGEGWATHIIRPGRSPCTVLTHLLTSLSGAGQTGRQTRRQTGPTPGSSTDRTDAGALDRSADPLLDPNSSAELLVRLRAQPGAFGVALRTWARRKRRRLLVFIDQFEELYTLGADADERTAFVACLEAAADDPSSPVRLVLSVRADFLDRLAEHRSFMDQVSRGLYFVTPLDRAGLREALTRPVEAAEHSFEDPALVEHMLDALEGTAGALPLLQFAAGSLWARRDVARRVLTRAGYRDMGGMAGALAVHADNVLTAMDRAERALTREVMLRLITPERTRAPAELSELRALAGTEGAAGPEAIDAVVGRLVDARLLVIEAGADDDNNDRMVEIVHESLISTWPTLTRWLDETREDAAFLARLRTAARQWDDKGRTEGMLWRGEPAREAEVWYSRYRGELPARERAYLGAVLALMRRTTRTRRMAVGGVIGGLVALLAAALITLFQINEAQKEALAQAELAQQRAGELNQAKGELEVSLASAQQARTDADEARQRAEDAKKDTENALEESRKASHNEKQARTAAEKAARERGQAIQRLETTLDKLQIAEADARAARDDAEAKAASERRLKERYEQIIKRALGAELLDEVRGARVSHYRAP